MLVCYASDGVTAFDFACHILGTRCGCHDVNIRDYSSFVTACLGFGEVPTFHLGQDFTSAILMRFDLRGRLCIIAQSVRGDAF